MEDYLADSAIVNCISHIDLNSDDIIYQTEQRLENSDNLALPLETELELLHQLTQFELEFLYSIIYD